MILRPDSLGLGLLSACGSEARTTPQILAATGGTWKNGGNSLYRLLAAGCLRHGPRPEPGRCRVTWIRTALGDDVVRRSAARLRPLQAYLLTCLSTADQRCNTIPCPAHLTRASSPASWRGVRCQVMRSLAEEDLIEWRHGHARLTPLGVSALPDARACLDLP